MSRPLLTLLAVALRRTGAPALARRRAGQVLLVVASQGVLGGVQYVRPDGTCTASGKPGAS